VEGEKKEEMKRLWGDFSKVGRESQLSKINKQ